MRTCLACGRITAGRYCTSCALTTKTYASQEYKANRAALLATATQCWVCGGKPTADDPFTADHIVGLGAGGSHAMTNLQPAHESCNKSRGLRMSKSLH